MNANELIKQILLSFNDKEMFFRAVQDYIDHEKRLNHTQVVKELEKLLYGKDFNHKPFLERRFKNIPPVPRDSEKGFPLLEVREYDDGIENLIVDEVVKTQLDQIIKEFKDSEVLASYGLSYHCCPV